jgi:hypothetical protein
MIFAVTMRKKRHGRSGERGRPTVAPDQLVSLSLYSEVYQGFVLLGWPVDLPYPKDARALAHQPHEGPLSEWYPYLILRAFCIGTSKGGRVHLLRFNPIDWSNYHHSPPGMSSLLRLLTPSKGFRGWSQKWRCGAKHQA